VHEGYVLTKGMHMSEVGGTMLSEALLCALVRGRHVSGEFPPRYAFRKVSRKGARGGAGAGVAAAAAAAASATGDVDMASGAGAGAGAGAGPRLVRALAGMDVYHADVPADLTRSFRVAAELEVVDDAKRSLCEVHETGYMEGVSAAPEARTYELPDGQSIKLTGLRHLIPELLFNADVADLLYSVDPADPFRPTLSPRDSFRHLLSSRATPAWLLHQHGAVSMRAVTEAGTSAQPIPLPKAVHGALLACAPEVRRDLCANVLLTGGGSNLRDLHKRMHWELSAVVPAAFKPRIVAPSPIEREFATWIGGSVLGERACARSSSPARANRIAPRRHPLTRRPAPPRALARAASLGTFQQMWLSRAEYEEEGVRVLEQKCQ
jgi:hypothetical protein